MKSTVIQLLVILILWNFYSCEKEIEVDVKNQPPQTVVEAQMSNHQGDAWVKLSETLTLNDTIDYPALSNAEITITDKNSNEIYYLSEFQKGYYSNYELIGIPGHTYEISILLPDNELITSSSIMPFPVTLDKINTEKEDFGNFGNDEEDGDLYKITPVFIDPKNQENFYQIKIQKNGKSIEEFNIFKDLGFNGLVNSQSVYIDAIPNDTLIIETRSITEPIYEYLLGVLQNTFQSSASPTNPPSNLNGNALGCFKTYAYDRKETVIIKNL